MENTPWFTVEKINELTYVISEYKQWEHVHSYLLIGKNCAALIDTGLGIDNIRSEVEKLIDKPIIVLTTHVHTDHIGNHQLFDDVRVHVNDASWLENGIEGLTLERIRQDLLKDVDVNVLPEAFDIDTYEVPHMKPAILLNDNDLIDLGERLIRVIHTPGHSPGHCCFLDLKYGYLFTGDLLYTTKPIYAFYPSTSPTDLLYSWIKLTTLEHVEAIYPSHYEINLPLDFINKAEKAAHYLMAHKLDYFGSGIHDFDGLSVQF